MRLVLAVTVFLTTTTVKSDVQCGNDKFCNVGFRPFHSVYPNYYHRVRKDAMDLAVLAGRKIIGVQNTSEWFRLVSIHTDLCMDDTIGFLLDPDVVNYQISCVWTGLSQYGQCQPVPPEYSKQVFTYIPVTEWSKRVENVRRALGCPERTSFSKGPRNRTGYYRSSNTELFVCNERCVQGGIGYTASIFIVIVLAASFFKNCVDGEP